MIRAERIAELRRKLEETRQKLATELNEAAAEEIETVTERLEAANKLIAKVHSDPTSQGLSGELKNALYIWVSNRRHDNDSRVYLLDGPYQGLTADIHRQPKRIQIRDSIYVQVTDPDTGETLNAYAFVPEEDGT